MRIRSVLAALALYFAAAGALILGTPRNSMAGAAAQGVFAFAGGYTSGPANNVDIYDATSDVLNTTTTLPTPRYYAAAAAVGNWIVVAGGHLSSGNSVTSEVLVYDVTTRQWNNTALPSLSVGRNDFAGASARDVVVFAGGAPSAAGDVVDIYNVTTGVHSTGVLSVGRYGLAAAGTGDYVAFAGGYAPSASSIVDIYNVISGTWLVSPPSLQVARAYLAAAATGKLIIFAGGATTTATSVPNVDILDITTMLITPGPDLSQARERLAAAAWGSIVIFAGGHQSNTKYDIIDVYNDTSGAWANTSSGAGSLSVGRDYLSGAGSNGLIIFAGGIDNGGASSGAIDIFNLTTNTIVPVTNPPTPPPSSSPTPGPSVSTAPPGTVTACAGTAPALGATCVAGVWIVPSSSVQIVVSLGQIVVVNGSLSLPSGGAIVVEVSYGTTTAPLTVDGTATLSGALTIIFVDEPADGAQIPIIDTAGATGSFATVDVQLPAGCKRATATVAPNAAGTLVALLSVDNGGCKSRRLSKGAIAGIVVGIVALLVIVTIIVLALVRHHAPACCAFRFNDDTAQFVS